MTPTLAAYIAANFEVVDSINTPDLVGSGFDATVWRGKAGGDYAGQVFVSMRGTEPGAGGADLVADADLALGTAARWAIVDMVNWWLKISTPVGQSAPQIFLESVYDYSTPPIETGTRVVVASNVPGLGLVSAAELAQGVQVDGHSMGGHMASAFARIFGANNGVAGSVNIQSIETFNSAGFNGSLAEPLFGDIQAVLGTGTSSFASVNAKQTNFFAANGVNVTTNDWWFTQMGTRVGLYQEETTGIGNHSMYRITDLLAVGAALEKLDSTFTMDKLNALSKVGSNDPKASLESVLDSLRRALAGPNIERLLVSDAADSDDIRVTFLATLAALQNNPIFKDLTGKLHIELTSGNLASLAHNDFGSLIALQDLSPLYINGTDAVAQAKLAEIWQAGRTNDYAAWQADKSSGTPVNFTDQWIADRAAMLSILLERNKFDQTGAISPNPLTGLVAGHYLDVSNSVDITVGTDTVTTKQYLFGGNATDTLTGRNAADHLYGGSGADTLNGQGGNDYLEGGSGADTYNFASTFGKDTILDSDGLGAIQIDGQAIGAAQAIGERGAWAFDLGAGVYAGLAVYDDPRSSTGKRLVITKGADTANTVTIDNFDLTAALGSQGYLGIKLDPTVKLVVKEGAGSNVWSNLSFNPATLAGTSAITEGSAKTFTLYLNQAAKAGETITLALSGLADKFMAILGDSVVAANGAVITLAEGQTQVSFALVQEGAVTANASANMSAVYAGVNGNVTSNSWGVNLVDGGPIGQTSNGDQRARIIGAGNETQLGITPDKPTFGTYAWSETSWATDGTLVNGLAELNFSDVIRGGAGNDKISGLGGNDALDGGAGNDEIDGGIGDDLIGGGAGSDNIRGGDGNDYINSSATLNVSQRLRPTDSWSPPAGQVVVTQGALWGIYKDTLPDGTPVTMWSGSNSPTGTDSDVIDGGAGDDSIIAGGGDDRVQGGIGDDQIEGMGGNDVLEGGDGKDIINGDGLIKDGFMNTLAAPYHGADFVDGGAGDDQLTGGGGNDVVYGGVGADKMWGDSGGKASESDYLDVAYHGNDYLDGEDGDDYIEGGGKNDTLYGGADNDNLWGDTSAANVDTSAANAGLWGDDYLDGEDGNDQLIGGGKDDALYGGTGNDSMWGDESDQALAGESNGNDYLDGEGGNDYMVGGGKDDILYGGVGDDTLIGDDELTNVAAEFQGADYLDGEDGSDYLVGGGGDDILLGGTGNDYMEGGTGADYMEGGAGDDTYVVDSEGDVIVEADVADGTSAPASTLALLALTALAPSIDNVQSSVTYTLGVNLDNLTLTGTAAINGAGNSLNNVLTGNIAANVLTGGAGDDFYYVDNVADTVIEVAGEGSDTVSSSVSFALADNVEQLQASGTAAIDLCGNTMDNGLFGNTESNVLTGGAGNDYLVGNAGNDVYAFNRGDGQDSINNTDFSRDTAEPDLLGATDTLRFGGGIADSDVIGMRSGDNLILKLKGVPDQVAIMGYYGADVVNGTRISDHKIDSVEFANGVAWDQAMIQTVVDRATNNHVPIATGTVPSLQARAGSVFSYTVPINTITDTDVGDSVTYSVKMSDGSELPSWLSFDAATRTLSGTPDVGNIGNLQFALWGTDNYGAAAGKSVNMTIDVANRAPLVASALLDQGGKQGSAFSYTVPVGAFADPDAGDVLTYAATLADGNALPAWLNFNANTRSFSGTPSGVGTTSVRVVASDGSSLNASDVFDIVVTASNTLNGTVGNDTLYGTTVAETLNGLAGNDTLYGDAGDDVLDGGTGNDHLVGQAGNDAYLFGVDSGSDILEDTQDAGGNIIQLAPGVTATNLRLLRTGQNAYGGMSTNDSLVLQIEATSAQLWVNGFFKPSGQSSVAEIRFADGSNTVWRLADIVAGAGASLSGPTNTLNDTAANDLLTVDNAYDTIIAAPGGGIDTVQSNVTYALPNGIENLELVGLLGVNGYGNAGSNVLRGNGADNFLDGRGGQDQFYGGKGNDTFVGDGQIFENANEGYDTHISKSYDVTLADNVDQLIVLANGYYGINSAAYVGNSLDNAIDVTGGYFSGLSVRIDGGAGRDTLIGGDSDNIFVVDNADDVVIETMLDRGTVESSVTYTLGSNLSNLTLTGTVAIDGQGNGLNNVLDGSTNGAANTLIGLTGNDTYRIDLSGTDTVVEQADGGSDTVVIVSFADKTPASIKLSDWQNMENLALDAALGNVDLQGTADNNMMYGSAGSNTIEGLDGDDTLYSFKLAWNDRTYADNLYPGHIDHLLGGNGNDTIFSYGGKDVVEGGMGNDKIYLEEVVFTTVDGGSGDDVIASTSGSYQLSNPGAFQLKFGVGSGNDTVSTNKLRTAAQWDAKHDIRSYISLDAGTVASSLRFTRLGASLVVGLSGNADSVTVTNFFESDTSSAAQSSFDAIRLNDGTMLTRDTIVVSLDRTDFGTATAGADVLVGQATGDVLNAAEGDDRVFGGDGNDQLTGGAGNDVLVGGRGADIYHFSAGWGQDVVDDLQLTVVADMWSPVQLVNDFAVDAIVFDASVSETDITVRRAGLDLLLTHRVSGDTITVKDYCLSYSGGYFWNNSAPQQQSNDGQMEQVRFANGTVWDKAYLTEMAAAILGTAGTDELHSPGWGANSSLWGLAGNDSLYAGTHSNDKLYGGDGDDMLFGSDGNDLLDGGNGVDRMYGDAGNDTFVIDNAGDQIIEYAGRGTDLVQSSITYTLAADFENLTLTGTAVIDAIGNGLANELVGNSANNSLDGGLGVDTMKGGAGDDTYLVDNTGDVVLENADDGTDLVQSKVTFTLGAHVENVTLTGTGAINATGNALDNTLTGNSGKNVLTGGAGNDTYIVGTSDTTIEAVNEGTDTVQSAITWTLATNVENLTLTGSGAVNGTGNTLNNVLLGNSAANILSGGTGADAMQGGQGNDTYVVDNIADVVTENLNDGTDLVQSSVSYTLGANVENLTLTGTAASNGTGNALNNTLTGNSGVNILDGGLGADTLVGGAGNDTYYVDNVGDITTEAASAGTDTVISSMTRTLGTNLENLTLSGVANINATGNTLANVLTGNAGDNILDGGTGNDTLVGGLGNDTYVVDVATDIVTEALNAGTDTVQSKVTLTLAANIENLTLTGTSKINGTGNVLDNVLTGNSAANVLTGGLGNDTYVVGTGDTTIEAANAGIDSVQSSIVWTLANNVENLTLTGTSAVNGTGNTLDNVLTGNSGNNTLTGAAGNDTLNGGAGTDILVGGAGSDTYWLGRGYGADTITENDATAGSTDVARFDVGISMDQLWFTHTGNNLDVSIIGTTDKFTLTNWYLGNQYHVEQFKTSDGKTLLDSQVQNLVNAMAGFAPPAAGQTTLSAAYQTSLAPVLAANWQ
jgi:Ca2+-binding RTX toxin-like protein